MYNNFVFDVYSTLINTKKEFDTDLLWSKLALHFGYHGACYDPEDLREKFKSIKQKLVETTKNEDDTIVDIEDVFYQLFKKKKVKAKSKLVKETMRLYLVLATEEIRKEAFTDELISALRNGDKRIFAFISGQASFGKLELKMLGLADVFDGVIAASECGCDLPDIATIDCVLSNFDLKKGKTVFISGNKNRLTKELTKSMDTIYMLSKDEEEVDIDSTHIIKEKKVLKILDYIK